MPENKLRWVSSFSGIGDRPLSKKRFYLQFGFSLPFQASVHYLPCSRVWILCSLCKKGTPPLALGIRRIVIRLLFLAFYSLLTLPASFLPGAGTAGIIALAGQADGTEAAGFVLLFEMICHFRTFSLSRYWAVIPSFLSLPLIIFYYTVVRPHGSFHSPFPPPTTFLRGQTANRTQMSRVFCLNKPKMTVFPRFLYEGLGIYRVLSS